MANLYHTTAQPIDMTQPHPGFSTSIRFDRITAHHVRIPMKRPFRISVGTVTEKEFVVLEGRCGDHVGWGEAAVDAVPFYTSETAGTAMHIARQVLGPLARSRAWSGPHDLAEAMDKLRGHAFTKAAFDSMAWDIAGRQSGVSVAEMIRPEGAAARTWVETGPSIGIKDTPAELVDQVAQELAAGARRIKIKVQPGHDVPFIEAVRRAWPDISLMVDANSAYAPQQMDHLAAWDRYGLLMIEQPFDHDDLFFHAELCRRMQTPICLDESIQTPHLCRCAIAMKAADIINIKVGRVAGLVGTRLIHDLCAEAGIGVWIGARFGSGIADAGRLAAASLPNALYPTDAGHSLAYVADDLIEPFFEVRDGFDFRVPGGAGLGVCVDRAKLARYTLASEDI